MLPWLTYPRINHFTVKLYSLVVPAILTLIAAIWYFQADSKPSLLGNLSLSSFVFSVFSLLPGFLIAALSAAATFGNPHVDEDIGDENTKMPIKIDGKVEWDTPSKRQIAIYLFYFLLINSIAVVLLSGAGTFLFQSPIGSSVGNTYGIGHGIYFVLLFFLSSVTLSSLVHGLTFFVERLTSLD